MTLWGLLILLVVAAIAGSIGQALAGFSGGGCVVSIVLGFIGAFLGQWLAAQLHLPEPFVLNTDGQPFPLLWAIIGAALLSAVLGLLSRRRAYV